MLGMVTAVAGAWGDASIKTALTEGVSSAAQLINDITGVVTSLAAMTETAVINGIAGAAHVVASAPALGTAMKAIVGALAEQFAGVVVSPELAAASTAASSIVSEITGVITSLGSMTAEAVQNGIWGAGWVATKAVELGEALRKMIGWIAYALRGIDATSLSSLQEALAVLSDIAAKIAAIINDLAGMTAEQVSAANAAGASLGAGFYSGLLSWHERIVAEAGAIARDAAFALGGTAPIPAAAMAYSGGGTTVVNNSYTVSVPIGNVQATSPQQVQAIGDGIAATVIQKVAVATAKTRRNAGR